MQTVLDRNVKFSEKVNEIPITEKNSYKNYPIGFWPKVKI